MKISELIAYGKSNLEISNNENALFDTLCILEQATGLNKTAIYLNADNNAEKEAERCFKTSIRRRSKGEPLQYILGKWEFMGMDFSVGPGVLIPRPETELLVELAVEEIRNRNIKTVVFDICAGTGCIGICVAKLCPNAHVFLLEKSSVALEYLLTNNNSYQLKNTTIIAGDLFSGFHASNLPKPDIILSNPPYVCSTEIEYLQSELAFEPREALDGGSDGFDFYKAINDLWEPNINPGGILALECGEAQAEKLSGLFAHSDNQVSILCDYNKIKRIVLIKKGTDTTFSE